MTQINLVAKQTSPMVASVRWNPQEDTPQDTLGWFNEFCRLPLPIRLGLASDKLQEAVSLLAKSYRINDLERIGEISRIIREVFTRGIRESVISQRVASNLRLTSASADHFMIDLRRVIAFVKKTGEEELHKDTEFLDIISALRKYPQISNQQVSERLLIVSNADMPVDPVVKNWLEDYFYRMGTEKHTTLQRTDYLFNSENGKRLSSTERDKLAILLKSYDNTEKIAIDTGVQEILFTEGMSENNEKEGIATPIEPLAAQPKPSEPNISLKAIEPSAVLKTAEPARVMSPTVNLKAERIEHESDAHTIPNDTPLNNMLSFPELKAKTAIAPRPAYQPRPAVVKLEEKKPQELAKNVVDLSEYI